MKLWITNLELSDIVRQKAGIRFPIVFETIDSKTLSIGVEINTLVRKKVVSIPVTIVSISGTKIHLNCTSGSAKLDFAISFLCNAIPSLRNKLYMLDIQGSQILVHLDKIEQAKKALEYISIQDISFVEDKLDVDFVLR